MKTSSKIRQSFCLPFCVAVFAAMALGGCKEEHIARPDPVDMTPEAVGFYCQMNLLEHDGPKAQIHLDGMPAPLFFSQVRDAVAYLHMPEQSHAVVATYVQDMSGARWDAPGAWVAVDAPLYVIGSDALGGMKAPEFVPFTNSDAAEAFVREHGGRIERFSEITAEEALVDASEATQSGQEADIGARLEALSSQKGF
ncbi:nitrous oxide reductase accessory protein NosL [Celeribacter sp.]|uniref:nitrous oxide reductase accessory protein NosL n=1 Tax=Celeribacter sp. TaxID=1890673 RepID=UPI003A955F70